MDKSFEKVWENCLSIIKDNVSAQSFKTWFEPIKPLKLTSNVLTIQVPSQFFYEWLEEHYITLLKKTVKKELGTEGRLEYSIVMENSFANAKPYSIKIPTSNKKALVNSPVTMPLDISNKEIRNPFIIPGLKKVDVQSQLNANYSFENFVEGECNRLARFFGNSITGRTGQTVTFTFNKIFE